MFLVDARVFLPELRILHEARFQLLQLRHVITCLIRSLAVAGARLDVLRDFFAKTCSTTTRRPAAVTQIPRAIPPSAFPVYGLYQRMPPVAMSLE